MCGGWQRKSKRAWKGKTVKDWGFWNWYWVVWLVVFFGVPEAVALITGHPEYTLSDTVWDLEGKGLTINRYLIACLLVWLFVHLVFGGFRSFRML